MNTSVVLDRAADVLQVRGWRGDGHGWHPSPEGTTPVCAEGAMRLANGGWRHQGALDALSAYLHDLYPECVNHVSGRVLIFSWNDRPGRTQAEVVEALRACAVIEASRERESVEVAPEPVRA